MDFFIFFACAIIAVTCSLLVILQKNPVASVIFLIMAFFAQAILYIQLSAIFVAVLQIVVYTGAIMVLFLFVIMLLNLRKDEFGPETHLKQRWLTRIFAVVMLVELAIIIGRGFAGSTSTVATGSDFGTIEQIAVVLFTEYLFPFELTSVLLIAALVGAVVLARKRVSED